MDAELDRALDSYMREHPEIKTRDEAQDAWLRENEHLSSTSCIDAVTSDAANIIMKRWGWL